MPVGDANLFIFAKRIGLMLVAMIRDNSVFMLFTQQHHHASRSFEVSSYDWMSESLPDDEAYGLMSAKNWRYSALILIKPNVSLVVESSKELSYDVVSPVCRYPCYRYIATVCQR